jgi:hypothetical protein
MLINEMMNDEKYESKLGYDLKDDLVFFMNEDPDFYRKKYYPAMLKYKKYVKADKKIEPRAFAGLVGEAYRLYQNKFPVEGLPPSLDDDMCKEICNYMHETETKNIKDGHYD